MSLTHGFSAKAAFDLKIITGEAINNIIHHAYENRDDKPIFIEALAYPSYLELRFRDVGTKKPIGKSMAQDLSDYREGGLGVYLISKLSDYHFYDQSSEVGTQLVVKKKVG